MYDQKKLEKFWTKLAKAGAEIQHDFAELDPQDKQVVKERIDMILKAKGVAVGVDALIGAMGNIRH